MAYLAELAVGLRLNATHFQAQLSRSFGEASRHSGQFHRQAQKQTAETVAAFDRLTSSVSGLAGRIKGLAGLAGLGYSMSNLIRTSRHYGQALSDLSAITGATGEQLKALDMAAQHMGRTTEYSAPQAAEALRMMSSARPELLKTDDGLARLMTENAYHQAGLLLAQNSTRQRLQIHADAAAAEFNPAGEVDPVIRLQNQLTQQQSLYKGYYAEGLINRQRYDSLIRQSAQESADAQYQAALGLYSGQSRLHEMLISLTETLKERTSAVLTGLLTGARSFKESMQGLFASLAESVIKNLVDMAAQALITRTLLAGIMGFSGGAAASSGGAGPSGFTTGAFSHLSVNAKGGVYPSQGLSHRRNSIVDKPVFFAFSRGAGVMGEA